MTTDDHMNPLTLLTDDRGPYGIHTPGGKPDPFLRENPNYPGIRGEETAVFRLPDNGDVLGEILVPDQICFHTLPKDNHRLFKSAYEAQLANRVFELLAERRNIDRAYCPTADPKTSRKWFATMDRARRITNHAVKAVYSTLDPNYLRVVRRFPVLCRGSLYTAIYQDGERAAQLAETFPLLAYHIYGGTTPGDICPGARRMIIDGRPLKDVAARVALPMRFRKLLPGASDLFFSHANEISHHLAHMPDTLVGQRRWVRAVRAAGADPDYTAWVARHALELGRTQAEIAHRAEDLKDWVDACRKAEVRERVTPEMIRDVLALYGSGGSFARERDLATPGTERFVTRRFTQRMAPRTVLRLSDEWHEAVSQAEHNGKVIEFPKPWYPGGKQGGFEITPITDSAALYQVGRKFHNCAANYVADCAHNRRHLYTVEKADTPIAMFELIPDSRSLTAIGQIRGPFNAPAPEKAERAVRTWWRKREKALGAGEMPLKATTVPVRVVGDYLDDIPC